LIFEKKQFFTPKIGKNRTKIVIVTSTTGQKTIIHQVLGMFRSTMAVVQVFAFQTN
jgi:hypothetical protein